MLSERTISLVKSTIPLLSGAGSAVTAHFYERMFSHNPELKHIFNMTNQQTGKQHFALFNAIAAYATHIDNPSVLQEAISRINHKHVSLNIQAEHYNIVGHHLIATLKELAPNEFTSEIEQAWREAYTLLADLFITQEEGLYQHTEQQVGGWRNQRAFIISDIVQESANVKSFYLMPKDGGPITNYQAGQFIALSVQPPSCDYTQIRQYSLSQSANKNTYRISVKKHGLVSTHLHQLAIGDTVLLYPPAGDFIFRNTLTDKVFISAGVGITPMMAMLEQALCTLTDNQLLFIHACANENEHSFKQVIESKAQQYKNVTKEVWYENTLNGDQSGRIELSQSKLDLPLEQGEFYLCGPTPFMAAIKQQLVSLGVAPERILYEVFGPHESL
ncbi:NO-inducible flavohemoprotein [Pseudoalteromonas sp. S16_S37]|uniref:NO-inducible flavohemoprotein n=1 Tax=Pseudoalteromonas sp. S16_S37 TaxID=2720228 RepID=UPI00168007FB|nr:NO-inducible flavohemoprotein [Pseudoalteromonas sp. S16_S37]MBD1582988.1 NO-inducible flavohemoprotein [Pseudoalteromonas sp. S16_S37]